MGTNQYMCFTNSEKIKCQTVSLLKIPVKKSRVPMNVCVPNLAPASAGKHIKVRQTEEG